MKWLKAANNLRKTRKQIRELRDFITIYAELANKHRRRSEIASDEFDRGWSGGQYQAFKQMYETVDEKLTDILEGK